MPALLRSPSPHATLVAWRHKHARRGLQARVKNLADLETDKVVLEVPAPADGVMGEHKFAVGATVTEGLVLAQIETGAAPAAAKPAAAAAAAAAAPAAAAAAKAAAPADAAKLSPSVRRLVEENKIDPAAVPGTGRDGRLTKSDVTGFLDREPACGRC